MKRLLTLILLVLLFTPAFSRSARTMLGVLTMDDGLPSNTVYHIHKDKNGFMWFGTDMGISKYDGYRFTNFQLSDKPTAIIRIVETPDSLLWLLNINGRVTCFDPKQEEIIPCILNSPESPEPLFSNLALAGNEGVCALSRQGLMLLHVDNAMVTKEKSKILSAKFREPIWKSGEWSLMCREDKGRIFAFSVKRQQIYCYNPETESAFTYDLSDVFADLQPLNITGMCVKDEFVWLYNRWRGIICYNLRNKEYREISISAMNNADIRDVVSLGGNDYCLATWNGLFKITFDENPVKGNYEISRLSNNVDNKIDNKSLTAYFDEKENLLWISTFGGGVLKYMPDNVFFRWMNVPENVDVNRIVQDNGGYIWLATVGNGLLKSTSSNVSMDMEFRPWNRTEFSSGKYSLYSGSNGMLWVGDECGNLYTIDSKTDEYKKYPIKLEDGRIVTSRIYGICQDVENNMWISTAEGVILFNQSSNIFSVLKIPELLNKETHDVACGADGDIWISTLDGLVRVVKDSKGNFSCITGFEKAVALEPSLPYSIFVCSDKSMIVTYADKVLFINNKNRDKPEKAFSLGHGLPNGQLYCIAEDLMGNLWFGGNSAIMTMKVGTNLIYNYSFGGNNTSVCCLSDGKLLWGSADGVFYYNPQKIKSSLGNHGLVLSRLMVDNQIVNVGEEINGQVLLPQSIHSIKKLVVNDANKIFRLYLTDLQYKTVSQKIRYRLLPDDKEWSVLNVKDGLTFADLTSGEHILQVRSVAYDGNMGDIEEFVIQKLPHWSVSWWAWGVYVFIFAFMCYLVFRIIRYRVHFIEKQNLAQEKYRNELYRVEVKTKQDREAMEVKSKFLKSITDELRTPLFMIIDPLREILNSNELSKTLQRNIEVAYYNSIGLKDLCTQIIDTYRLESDGDYLQVTKLDLLKILDDVLNKQKESLNIYKVELVYDKPDVDLLEIWADKDMVEFVIRSLLANAYRHVRYIGKVTLGISQQKIEGDEFFVLSISDNGENKIEENIKDYLSSTASINDVVDYSLVELRFDFLKRIIDMHHGKIYFQSNEGEDTRIFVYFKSGKEHYNNDAHITFVSNVNEDQLDDMLTLSEAELWNIDEELSVDNDSDKKKRLLVVEDNMALRMYIKAIFSSDYEVIEAINGQEGIDVAHEKLPDLILCDVMMPVKNGFDCCRELKGDIRTCHIPIIFLSARGMDEDIMTGMDMGADDYLQKPMSSKLLKAKVDNIIKSRENLKQVYANRLISPIQKEDSQSVIEDEFMKRVIELVEEHMHEIDFGVINLAKMLNMSQPTLYRKVKQCTDFNIAELIRGVRLKRAAQLLLNEEYPIQEVVEKVGYNDSATFRKHFMKQYGVTPSMYIKQNKANG